MPRAAYTDGYQPFQFADFAGGLNLRDKSDAVGDREAIDLLNVTFSERGAIRQRDGYVDLTGADLTNRIDSLSPFYTVAGLRQLVAGAGTRIDVIDQNGAPVAARTGLGGGPYEFVRFADSLHEYLYAANGIDPLQRWNGAAWTSGAAIATVNGTAGQAMPKAGAVCVTATVPGSTSGANAANRLVATAFGTLTNGGPGGQPTNPSRVYLSNPGLPEVWETDGNLDPLRGRNYIDLTPGDGERILAAVTWRELVFIFKETKFFVLWGEGIGIDNNPTFQVREVVNNVGLAAAHAVAVGRDGVYWMNRRGVYRSNGGDPQLLSDVISPMWTQDPEVYFRSKPINLGRLDLPRMLWHMERLYLAVPTGSATANDRTLVYDTQHNWWGLDDTPAAALASFRATVAPEVHFGYAAPQPQRIGSLRLGQRTDRGAVITSRWRSGWSDYASSQVKTIRETKAWGDGAATASFSIDFNIDQSASLTARFRPLGEDWTYDRLRARGGNYTQLAASYASYDELADNTSLTPVLGEAMLRRAIRGTVFSTEFANSDEEPSWAVHRVTRHMREVREPSVMR